MSRWQTERMQTIVAPMPATVVSVLVTQNERVRQGQIIAVLESMKIEHEVTAPTAGVILSIPIQVGANVKLGDPLFTLREQATADLHDIDDTLRVQPTNEPRSDLASLIERQAGLSDRNRPDAVEKRHRLGRRTARENLNDLVEADTWSEIGGLAIAAQSQRHGIDELRTKSPADGVICGTGTIRGMSEQEGNDARVAVIAYDYTVMAGTQGMRGHLKTDRFLAQIEGLRIPLILLAEGGGGRPGDTDYPVISGNNVLTFRSFARLSGHAPLIGVVSGRCFAGNAALAACCDVIIATPDANLAMAGPAMVEGGGLGVFAPEELGPFDQQCANGVIDIAAEDDADAVRLAKQYLSYFTQPRTEWTAADQDRLRDAVPEHRRRAYDVRALIEVLFDAGSVLELRPTFAPGMVTALARVEGRPVGVIANDPRHLGGAIDADGADSASRMIKLCATFGLPLVSVCDTPGFMVGPDAEATGQVKPFGQMMIDIASFDGPLICVITRKGYGLGALAMAGGSFHATSLTVGWPTGEVGGMGIEGAVTLGAKQHLASIDDPEERAAEFERLVASMYERSRIVNAAEIFEVDDVIDPADTRSRIMATLRSYPPVSIAAELRTR